MVTTMDLEDNRAGAIGQPPSSASNEVILSDSHPTRVIPLDDEKHGGSCSLTKRAMMVLALTLLVIGAVVGVALGMTLPSSNNKQASTSMVALTAEDYEARYTTFRSTLAGVSDASGFLRTDSPQSQALEWLVYKDTMIAVIFPDDLSDTMQQQLVQRYAVVVLLYALRGSTWQTTAAAASVETPLTELHECAFDGITCQDNAVTRLEWFNKNLAGSLSNEIALLTSLEYLDLSSNYVDGPIPESLYGLVHLKSLLLQANDLTTTISPNIGKLSNLQELRLSVNYFTGTLPSELESLTLLQQLDLANNRFTGTVWDTVAKLTALEVLDLGVTTLTGTIPESIGDLTSLTSLSIMTVEFQGSLPDSIANLTNLMLLLLYGPNLEGPFPSKLGQLTKLAKINIQNTHLTGSLPSGIGFLTDLKSLQISGTDMTGTLPSEIGHLTKLTELNIDSNLFTGTIPSELSNAQDLRLLVFATSDFSGDIEFVCAMPDLAYYYSCDVTCDCCYKTCHDCAKATNTTTSTASAGCVATTTTTGNGTRFLLL